MFRQSLVRAAGPVKNARYFRCNAALRDVKQTSTPTSETTTAPKTTDPHNVLSKSLHRVTDFDKRMLVWMKKFPNKESVPDRVGLDFYHNVQSRARIRVCNIMIVGTLIGCVIAVISGKRDAKAGKSLHKRNTDWHNEINEEYRASQEAAAAAAKTS